MTRVKRGAVARKRRQKILQLSKGFRGSQSKLFRTANQQVMKAQKYTYIDRRKKKIYFRRLWIRRINVSSRMYSFKYSTFIYGLKILNIFLNRKVLSQLSVLDGPSFKTVVYRIWKSIS